MNLFWFFLPMIKRSLFLLSIFAFLLGGACSSETPSATTSEPPVFATKIQKKREKPEDETEDAGSMNSNQRDRLDELADILDPGATKKRAEKNVLPEKPDPEEQAVEAKMAPPAEEPAAEPDTVDSTHAADDASEGENADDREPLPPGDPNLVDEIFIGDEASESEHKLKGDRTRTGRANDHSWRDAHDGGWISYEMKVHPEKPVQLVCTYWGGDDGDRVFDILVDKDPVETVTLRGDRPGEFFEKSYRIPDGLTLRRETVVVKFRAHPGKIVGGLYKSVKLVLSEDDF